MWELYFEDEPEDENSGWRIGTGDPTWTHEDAAKKAAELIYNKSDVDPDGAEYLIIIKSPSGEKKRFMICHKMKVSHHVREMRAGE